MTQYGDISHRPEPEDVLNYLRWCRDWQRLDAHEVSRARSGAPREKIVSLAEMLGYIG